MGHAALPPGLRPVSGRVPRPKEAAHHEPLFRLSRLCGALGPSPCDQAGRDRDRHLRAPRKAQRPHLRRLRGSARSARRAVPRAVGTRARSRRRGARILLGRRRRGDHRRHPGPGHRPAPRLQPDDRTGRPGAAGVPLPGDRRRARGRGGRGRGPRAGRRLPGRRPDRPLRVPLHPGRAVRRRHGRRLSAAARRRPRARDPAADAGGTRTGAGGRADRPDQRADRRGPGGRAGRRAGPPPRRGPGARVRADQGAAHRRTRHAARRRGRTGRHHPGVANER